MPTPDNPEEFYLLLALVTAMLPLQWYLGRKLLFLLLGYLQNELPQQHASRY